jgi:DNA-directed RNA polymerase subunit RPC12/RpoP
MIIYKCDRCGKEFKVLKIVISVANTNPMRRLYDNHYQVCDDCYNKFVKFMKEEMKNETINEV